MERWWLPDEGRPVRNNQPVGTMENERIAEKLRDPEGYAKIWGKNKIEEKSNSSQISSLWLIPAILATAGITAMVCWMLMRKPAKRQGK
jgi:hypothetical protein